MVGDVESLQQRKELSRAHRGGTLTSIDTAISTTSATAPVRNCILDRMLDR